MSGENVMENVSCTSGSSDPSSLAANANAADAAVAPAGVSAGVGIDAGDVVVPGDEVAPGDAPLEGEVVIIGYGTAGVNAAIALRNAGYEGVIRAFSDTALPPYSPILTSYYAGGEKAYEQCFPWDEAFLADLRVDLMADCPVVELDPAARVVRTAQGDFPYAKCLVSSGARPSLAGFPVSDGYEPLVLRTMADAERFKAVLEDGACKRVLVSGASMIALKSVEACLKQGVAVELVGMNEHVLDRSALPAAAERFERGLRGKGVALRLGQTVASVAMRSDAADGAPAGAAGVGRLEVTFSNGDVEFFDDVLVAHGVRSNLDFVAEGSLDADRALVVDEFMRTSDAHVYAAGDVAQALELVSGEKQVLGIWKTAAMQGACAGAAIAAEMAGRVPAAEGAYAGAVSSNTIAVDGTLFISGGVAVAGADCEVEVREADDMTVVCVFERGESADAASVAEVVAAAEAAGVAVAAEDGEAPKASELAGAARAARTRRLVGFNVVCDKDEPGGVAYDTGAMLTLRIESAFRR